MMEMPNWLPYLVVHPGGCINNMVDYEWGSLLDTSHKRAYGILPRCEKDLHTVFVNLEKAYDSHLNKYLELLREEKYSVW